MNIGVSARNPNRLQKAGAPAAVQADHDEIQAQVGPVRELLEVAGKFRGTLQIEFQLELNRSRNYLHKALIYRLSQ